MMMMMITLFLSLSKLLKLGRCFVHVVIWCRDCMVGGGGQVCANWKCGFVKVVASRILR